MTTTRTIPSKEQVLKAASECPQTKDALRILFPQDFESCFDWNEFKLNPFKHLTFDERVSLVEMSEALKAAYFNRGKPVPKDLYPRVSLRVLARLFDFLHEHAGE